MASIDGLMYRAVATARRASGQDVACLSGLTMDGDFLQLILELRDLVDALAAGRAPALLH